MLRAFSLKNFQSFRDEASLSWELSKHFPADDRSAETHNGDRLSKVMAVIGPNASGKTTLIKSIGFVDWFVKYSFQSRPDAPIPLEPHFLARDQPSEFQIEFDMEGEVWRYRLSATSERVLSESLHRKQSRTFSYVFTRIWDPQASSYVVKQQQFGMPPREAVKARQNASLISTAAQFEVALARRLVALSVFTNVTGMGRSHMDSQQILRASELYATHAEYQTQMSDLLQQWDMGLSKVTLRQQEITLENGEKREITVPYGVHQIQGREYELLLMEESSGTQGAFTLLSRLLPALATGGLAVMHPHMLVSILDLFFSPKSNPHGAQILCTTHAIDVMHQLHKEQIVLVEKDAECCSDAWRLDEMKGIRPDENLYAKYMAGAYGAVPQL